MNSKTINEQKQDNVVHTTKIMNGLNVIDLTKTDKLEFKNQQTPNTLWYINTTTGHTNILIDATQLEGITINDMTINNLVSQQILLNGVNLENENTTQNTRITTCEATNATQTTNITNLQNENATQNTRLDTCEATNATQTTNITNLQNENATQNNALDNLAGQILQNINRIDAIETLNTTQNTRLDTCEATNTTQNTNITINHNDILTLHTRTQYLRCIEHASGNNYIFSKYAPPFNSSASNNVIIGDSNNVMISGNQNILLGGGGKNITYAINSFAAGFGALGSMSGALYNNLATGVVSLSVLNNGSHNSAYGVASGTSLSQGSYNNMFGYRAGDKMTSGNFCEYLGSYIEGTTGALKEGVIGGSGTAGTYVKGKGSNTLLLNYNQIYTPAHADDIQTQLNDSVSRVSACESVNTTQNSRLTTLESSSSSYDTSIQSIIARLNLLEYYQSLIKDVFTHMFYVGQIILLPNQNTSQIQIGGQVFLLCNGNTFSQTAFPYLYAFLGSTTLPNYTTQTTYFAGGSNSGISLGVNYQSASHTLTVAEMPSHNHYTHIPAYGDSTNPSSGRFDGGDSNEKTSKDWQSSYTGGNTPFTIGWDNRPYTVIQHPYICASPMAFPTM